MLIRRHRVNITFWGLNSPQKRLSTLKMDKVINLGIPHVAERVFKSINTPGLIKCLKVSQTWFELAGNVLIKRWKGKIRSKMFGACKTGKTKIVQLILERCKTEEIGLNMKSSFGMTPLMWACHNGHKDVVKLLLDYAEQHSIDLNAKDVCENTAFIWACSKGHTDVVKLLLHHSEKHSIDLNAKDDAGWTALMDACVCGHKDVVKLLLDHCDGSIDFNAKDNYGRTALTIASQRRYKDIIVQLIKAKLSRSWFRFFS